MKIQQYQSVKTLITTDIFEDVTPQPEIDIKPVHQQLRQKFLIDATKHVLVPYPDKDGYHMVEQFDQWRFMEAMIVAGVVALRHFEDEKGAVLTGEKDGEVLALIRALPAQFARWLYEQILRLSDDGDFTTEAARKNYWSSRERSASAKAKK